MTQERNRIARARERAGLSPGQAAKLLGITRSELVALEDPTLVINDENARKLCDLYGVNEDWLRGRVPLRDYDSIKGVPGYEDLTFHDRDVVAEFAASLPRGNAERARMILCKGRK